MNMMLSTQMDKTTEALFLLDSLIHKIPFSEQRFENSKSSMINSFSNAYPYFRDISKRVVVYQNSGFTQDPNKEAIDLTKKATEQEMKEFYTKNVKDNLVTYLVLGNKKKVDMDKLKEKAKVIFLDVDDVMK
ncbi:MAG: hypothetical protein CSB15_01910 [Clostridiales bacterium]|nr:MAG: hypothetical protein CSB15_01910 [Clostridiales bacterium]